MLIYVFLIDPSYLFINWVRTQSHSEDYENRVGGIHFVDQKKKKKKKHEENAVY